MSGWRRLLRRDVLARVRIRWRIDVVRRLTKDAVEDQRLLLAHVPEPVVLDVGANVGHVTAAYRRAFPRAHIVAFEAAPAAARDLRARVAGDARTEVVEAAVAAEDGVEATFHVTPLVGTSSLRRPLGETSEELRVTTCSLDAWCARAGIDHVDVLKVDVEGAELEVLAGAAGLLSSGAIGLICAEARLVAETEGGVLLHDLATRLAADGYLLHNVYGLVESRALGAIYGNATFLGPRLRAELVERLGDRAFVQRLGHRARIGS